MLGVAVFHLLPHAVYSSTASIDFIAACLMAGLLGMFFLQRLFHFHHHELETVEENYATHQHSHEHSDDQHTSMPNPYGVLLGLGIHSVIDGLALASSMQADFGLQGASAMLPGLGVFIAIVLHKPLDALTLMLVMREQNMPGFQKQIALAAYALICPLMAAVGLYAFSSVEQLNPVIISATLAFSAGLFLCIALSDLLPEIHFHDHDRFKMTVVLLAGVAVSLLIKEIEAGERHSHLQQSEQIDVNNHQTPVPEHNH